MTLVFSRKKLFDTYVFTREKYLQTKVLTWAVIVPREGRGSLRDGLTLS